MKTFDLPNNWKTPKNKNWNTNESDLDYFFFNE